MSLVPRSAPPPWAGGAGDSEVWTEASVVRPPAALSRSSIASFGVLSQRPPRSAIQPGELREFAGQFPTGVAIVTLRDSRGRLHGATMNSVTSLSLDPPLFLICVGNRSRTRAALRGATHFCIHYLAHDQEALARHFAVRGGDRFTGLDHHISALGNPILPGTLAHCELRIVNRLPGGDHSIVIGQACSIEIHSNQQPLVFHRGRMFTGC